MPTSTASGSRPPPTPRQQALRLAAVAVLLLVVLAVHWLLLLRSWEQQRQQADRELHQRAEQMVGALTRQVDTLVGSLDYMAAGLASAWSEQRPRFDRATREVEQSLPPGALLQIAIADTRGQVIYSSLGASAGQLSIADREHFQVHLRNARPQLFISQPLLGRLSGRWSIQFSRPILREGRFDGVIVLSISPEYLAENLRSFLPQDGDAISLLRQDGSYLTRSSRLPDVLGTRLPPSLDFYHDEQRARGHFDGVAPVDGMQRHYVWQRTVHHPLLVVLGLDRSSAAHGIDHTIAASFERNLALSLLILFGAGAGGWALRRKQRHLHGLRETGERLQLALQGGNLSLWDWDLAGDRLTFDGHFAQTLGYAPDELPTHPSVVTSRIHADDRAALRDCLIAHLKGDSGHFESEHRLQHRDGHWLWVQARGRVMRRDADGRALRVVGTLLDIGPRKQAEQAQAELQARLGKLAEQVPGVIFQFLLRPDGSACFPYASPSLVDMHQVTPAEAAADAAPIFASLHPDDVERIQRSIQRSAEELSLWSERYRVIGADGRERWMEGHSKPERQADGSILWHGHTRDVTEEQATARALRASEERLRMTVAAVRDGLWEWDLYGDRLSWDARCAEILGHADLAHLDSLPALLTHIHPADRDQVLLQIQQQSATRQHFSVEFRLPAAGGEWLWVASRGRVMDWQGRWPRRMLGTLSDIHERVSQDQLRRALLEQSAAAIFLAAPNRCIHYANARAQEIFGQGTRSFVGSSFRALHLDDATYQAFGAYYQELRSCGQLRLEHPLRDGRGQVRWFDLHGSLLDLDQPEGDVIWTMIDITEQRLATQALAAERSRLTAIVDHFPGGVLVEDQDGCIVLANRSLNQLFNLPLSPDELVGVARAQLPELCAEPALDWLGEPCGILESCELSGPDTRILEVDRLPISSASRSLGHLWLLRDITERKQREMQLEVLAATDELTGLPNRRAFLTHLDQAVADRYVGFSEPGVVLMLDIDYFKKINDTYGHAVGDQVLQHMAHLLQTSLRRGDIAGRLGGEEFAVLLPDTPLENGLGLAERLRRTLAENPAATDAGALNISASIGVSQLDDCDSHGLLRRADEALYVAKHAGRNRVQLWQEQDVTA